MSSLLVDWCSYDAAKFAVMNWHYSKTMPFGKMAKIGAWEDEIYKGCVVFSYGATPNIGSPYGLDQFEVCELTRVALNKHKNKVSEILSRSISMLKAQSPGLRLIVSFADMEQYIRHQTGFMREQRNREELGLLLEEKRNTQGLLDKWEVSKVLNG